MNASGILEIQKVDKVALLLKGQALESYRDFIKRNGSYWEDLKQTLTESFENINAETEARERLKNLRQNRSVVEYNDIFSEQLQPIKVLNELDKLAAYLPGLQAIYNNW